MSSKQYGLILPGKNEKAPKFKSSRNVFGDDSDSDTESGPKKPMLRTSEKIKKQVVLAQEKALIEDPTVYQYDELYDNMEIKKKEEKSASKVEKKPRYIEKLLESANKRKKENERRLERQVQKEREKEGSEFADKESFVTSAYKQKLEELRAEEEREKREEYLENIGDVTKQQDLGGFYRHLYEQKLGPQSKDKISPEKDAKFNTVSLPLKRTQNQSQTTQDSEHSPPRKIRNYRKRSVSSEAGKKDLSDGEIVSDEEKLPTLKEIKASKSVREKSESNIDADSDFSIDSDDSENENQNVKNKEKMQNKKTDKDKANKSTKRSEDNFKKPDFKILKSTPESKSPKQTELVSDKVLSENVLSEPAMDDTKENAPPKPKVNIWEKRTVGIVFEEALRRYYERKAARSQ